VCLIRYGIGPFPWHLTHLDCIVPVLQQYPQLFSSYAGGSFWTLHDSKQRAWYLRVRTRPPDGWIAQAISWPLYCKHILVLLYFLSIGHKDVVKLPNLDTFAHLWCIRQGQWCCFHIDQVYIAQMVGNAIKNAITWEWSSCVHMFIILISLTLLFVKLNSTEINSHRDSHKTVYKSIVA
jgi:hypothetical protein